MQVTSNEVDNISPTGLAVATSFSLLLWRFGAGTEHPLDYSPAPEAEALGPSSAINHLSLASHPHPHPDWQISLASFLTTLWPTCNHSPGASRPLGRCCPDHAHHARNHPLPDDHYALAGDRLCRLPPIPIANFNPPPNSLSSILYPK